MAHEDAETRDTIEADRRPARRSIVRRTLLIVGLLLGSAVLFTWFERYRIADDILADELTRRGIEGRYRIEEIGPSQQVLTDIVIGDPAQPDLTIERVEIRITHRLGLPAVRTVRVVAPRLYGTWTDGELSFGALDPLIFGEEDGQPFEFPDLTLSVEDGRGLIDTEYGPVGLKLAGAGHLRGGFAAELAAIAPTLALGDCAVADATLYGTLAINAERPRFSGPFRFDSLDCEETGLALAGGAIGLDLRADRALTGVDGEAALRLNSVELEDARLAALEGGADFTFREQSLTARYELEGRDFTAAAIAAAELTMEGLLRTRRGFERAELEGELTGHGIRPGPAVDAELRSAIEAGSGTLLEPLLARVRRQLASESRNSTLVAGFTARAEDERLSLVVPEATLRGRSGATLLSLSRGSWAAGGAAGKATLSGNFATGGEGLPRISGRFEQGAGGAMRLQTRMAQYTAGEARITVPELALSRDADGAIVFDGRLLASGLLPGGRARNLALPIAGTWTRLAGLSLWPECTSVRFDALEISNLAFERQRLALCPPRGAAIVRYDEGAGLRIAAGVSSLDLAGRLGQTPIAIASGPVGIAWPGALSARDLDIALGPPGTAARFVVSDLAADFDRGAGSAIGGDFAGADIFLHAVPLDLFGASGDWRYAGGRLAIADGRFTLEDRADLDRFRPLAARDAALSIEDNLIVAEAALREPGSNALVTRVAIRHDLATGSGSADLDVPGIRFGEGLQPVDLTPLALGVVAGVKGTVTGSGRIDWNEAGVTSTGRFSSDTLDFAAAFGPVAGASGTIEFIDLLGLTTAPRQRIAIEAFNPGIEVYDGEVLLQLRGGEFIDVQRATWPFLGGTLAMRPLTIAVGVSEQRGYVLDIAGLDAASFIERMELNNFAASGTFDGTIPVIFDAAGIGRLEGGLLRSRPPGGNLAYVGELTYEDLSPMANFAFDTLRSLDYRQMRITMDGPLTGELVTRVTFEGVSQGAGAQSNFITRRLARLPVRMIVNLRAPFYRLISSVRSLYDPSAVRDPRDLGLLDNEGQVLLRETDDDAVEALDAAREAAEEEAKRAAAGEDDIQPTESEQVP